MIGNEYLQELYKFSDRDTSINQLLEFLRGNDKEFIDSLATSIDLDHCTKEELAYLTIVTALIDYNLQINNLPIPLWIRDSRLNFVKPFFYSSRLNDFEKVRLLYTSPAPFKARNVYFDVAGLHRV